MCEQSIIVVCESKTIYKMQMKPSHTHTRALTRTCTHGRTHTNTHAQINTHTHTSTHVKKYLHCLHLLAVPPTRRIPATGLINTASKCSGLFVFRKLAPGSMNSPFRQERRTLNRNQLSMLHRVDLNCPNAHPP